jgi:hypothetical protein
MLVFLSAGFPPLKPTVDETTIPVVAESLSEQPLQWFLLNAYTNKKTTPDEYIQTVTQGAVEMLKNWTM